MKNRLNVLAFFALLFAALYISRGFLQSWMVGTLSVVFTLSVIFIGIIIFFENRHPTKTLTWLLVLAAFPVVGFFFYLMFGQNHRKSKRFSKKAIEDERAFQKIEGQR
ncbi:PLDc N-terminal domain-containing protein, partial [Alkalihalophilus marmarensis]